MPCAVASSHPANHILTPTPPHPAAMAGRPVKETKKEDVLGNISSPFDSTLVYSDAAEEARLNGDYKEAGFLYLKSINLRRKKFGNSNVAIAPTLVKYAEVMRMEFKYKVSCAYRCS
jgi:hypothetical protein